MIIRPKNKLATAATASCLAFLLGIAASSGAPGQNVAFADGAVPAGNLSISAPADVSFVAHADGTLVMPSADALYLENLGGREARVSKLTFTPGSNWNLVADVTRSDAVNSVDIAVEPRPGQWTGGGEDLGSAGGEVEVGGDEASQAAWTMGSSQAATAYGWTSGMSDASAMEAVNARIPIAASGNVANVTKAGTTTQIGTMGWYVVDDTVTNDVYDKIAGLQTAVDGKTNTRVKGNAESDYRTGDVNLTYANLGTAPVANGGTGATTAAAARTNLEVLPSFNVGAVDLDTLQTTGVYHITASGFTHAPVTNWGTVYVDFTVGTPYQIYIPDNQPTLYKRHYTKSTSTWNAWIQITAAITS